MSGVDSYKGKKICHHSGFGIIQINPFFFPSTSMLRENPSDSVWSFQSDLMKSVSFLWDGTENGGEVKRTPSRCLSFDWLYWDARHAVSSLKAPRQFWTESDPPWQRQSDDIGPGSFTGTRCGLLFHIHVKYQAEYHLWWAWTQIWQQKQRKHSCLCCFILTICLVYSRLHNTTINGFEEANVDV